MLLSKSNKPGAPWQFSGQAMNGYKMHSCAQQAHNCCCCCCCRLLEVPSLTCVMAARMCLTQPTAPRRETCLVSDLVALVQLLLSSAVECRYAASYRCHSFCGDYLFDKAIDLYVRMNVCQQFIRFWRFCVMSLGRKDGSDPADQGKEGNLPCQ